MQTLVATLPKIYFLFLFFLCGMSGGAYLYRQIHPEQIQVIQIWDFSGEAEKYVAEQKKEFDEITSFHGKEETYFMWKGKLWLERDGDVIDAKKAMERSKKQCPSQKEK